MPKNILPNRKYQHALMCALLNMLVWCLPQVILAESYDKNTALAPKAQVITEGGIRMEIGKTIRLTPAPISAWHPWMKAVRLKNGDLIFNCPLSDGQHRDYALSPEEDKTLCSLISKDNGETWHKYTVQTSEDEGKTWYSSPANAYRPAVLTDGSLLSYGRLLNPTTDQQLFWKIPQKLGYGLTMIQLKDGSVLCAGQKGGLPTVANQQTITGGCHIQLWLSTDKGLSWRESGTLSFQNFTQDLSKGFEGYAEPFLVRAANGDLLMMLRTSRHDSTGKQNAKLPPVKVTRSSDEGKTWSKPIEVHPTGVMPVATVLDNGIVVAFTGRRGNRVAASLDNGLTWHCHHNIMSTSQSPNFSGHNTIVPVGPSCALLIYTHNHPHPDNEKDDKKNKYAAEIIGTFVTFQPVPKKTEKKEKTL